MIIGKKVQICKIVCNFFYMFDIYDDLKQQNVVQIDLNKLF